MSEGTPASPSDSVKEESPVHEKDDLRYSDDNNSQGAKALYNKKAKEQARELIIAAFVLAAVLAAAHHIFLSQLNNRIATARDLKIQQLFAAVSNGLAKGVAICLGFVVASSLVQATWDFVDSTDASINSITDVFALPAPLSMLSLLRRPWTVRLVIPFGLAILAHSLLLVSTFAPGALTIEIRKSSIEALVPLLDASANKFEDNPFLWDDTVSYLMITNVSESWNVPQECDDDCSFTIPYQAPGISCRDLNPSEISLKPYSPQQLENGGNWTFFESSMQNTTDWNSTNTFFDISYIPMTSTVDGKLPINVSQTSSIGGVRCMLRHRQYLAHFSYENLTATITAEAIADTNNFTSGCDWSDLSSSEQCQKYAHNVYWIFQGFADVFRGSYEWSSNGVSNSVYDQFAMKDIFQLTNDTAAKTVDFTVATATDFSLTDALEQNFTSITLGVLLNLNLTQEGSVHVDIPDSWQFRSWYLWAIYGSAFALVLVAAIYGLSRNQISNIPLDKTFSSLFVATRSNHLDLICDQSYDDIMESILRHDHGTGHYLLQKGSDQKVEGSGVTNNRALTQTKSYVWTRMIMIATYAAAVAVCIGHHFWLKSVDGFFVVEEDQTWIKGTNNAFSHAVGVCLTIAATFSLTQACWRYLKHNSTRMRTIDDLLALPSPKALTLLVLNTRRFQMIHLISIALVMQSIALVTILAPLALDGEYHSDGTADESSIIVPTLDLSSHDYSSSPQFSSIWDGLISRLIIAPPKYAWTAPENCTNGETCFLSWEYEAPALSCRDAEPHELTVAAYDPSMDPDSEWIFFDSTSSRLNGAEWEGNNGNTPFTISYIPMTSQDDNNITLSVHPGNAMGTVCKCMEGTYNATFSSTKEIVSVSSQLLYYNNDISTECNFADDAANRNVSSNCDNYGKNSLAICSSFAWNFGARVYWIPEDDAVFPVTNDAVVFGKIMNYGRNLNENGTYTLEPIYANLSQTMVDFFTNVTLGLLPTFGATGEVNATISDISPIWFYEVRTLWSIYIPALAVVLGIVIYGLYCINDNDGMVMDKKFSTFLITTRTGELDRVYSDASDYAALMETKLIYDKSGRFVVDSRDGSSTALGL